MPPERAKNARRGRFRPRRQVSGVSEKAELLGTIADQQVLRLLVVVEHHLVGFSADARLLVSAERRMCGISVKTIGPAAARLYGAAEAVEPVGITAPDTRAEPIERVVGDR